MVKRFIVKQILKVKKILKYIFNHLTFKKNINIQINF